MRFNEKQWANAAAESDGWELSLVIDTEQYAGNFERALTAACTGVSDETCNDADELAASYDGPDLGDVIGGTMDDHGNWRRCEIWPTPGWGNDGNGGHYRVTPDRPAKYAAYMSVRIPLLRPLKRKELDGVITRARSLAATGGPVRNGYQMTLPFTVTGFRLLRTRITSEWVRVKEKAAMAAEVRR